MIQDVIREISLRNDCQLFSASGLPTVDSSEILPEDLVAFYTICGGASLFIGREFAFRIVPPSEFSRASPIIHGSLYRAQKSLYDQDISNHWYVIADSQGPEERIVIDVFPERSGRCYDGHPSVYASSDCKVIAASFEEFLRRLIECEGRTLYWSDTESIHFKDLAYAYDGMEVEPPAG